MKDARRQDERLSERPSPPHSPPSLVAFRRLVGRSLVPPSLPLAAFGASFRGEWRVMEGRGNDKRRPDTAAVRLGKVLR